MNKSRKLGWQCHSIEKCIEVIMGLLGCTRDEAFEYARTRTRTRVNILTSTIKKDTSIEINKQVNNNGREWGHMADATARAATHTQPISLGGLFRALPKRVPETYALWWWRYMKDREWQLTNGRRVTPQTWRMNLITFYNAAKSGELAEAKDEYNRFFGKAFPVQEKTAAEEWAKCHDCDHFANGHCMACALRPPQSAALCPRFISNPTHL